MEVFKTVALTISLIANAGFFGVYVWPNLRKKK